MLSSVFLHIIRKIFKRAFGRPVVMYSILICVSSSLLNTDPDRGRNKCKVGSALKLLVNLGSVIRIQVCTSTLLYSSYVWYILFLIEFLNLLRLLSNQLCTWADKYKKPHLAGLEVLDLLRGISLKMKIKEPFRLLPPFPIKNSCSEAGGREGAYVQYVHGDR